MLAGKVWECQRLEFKIEGSGSGVDNGTGYAYAGELSSFYCANAVNSALGLSIGLASRTSTFPGGAPSGNWEVIHDGIISASTTGTGFNGSLSGSIEVDDYVIYNEVGTWTMKWSAVRAYANGSLVASSGAGSYTSARFAPDAIYPHGIPPFLEGGAGVGATPPINTNCPPGTPPSGTPGEASGNFTGGWRFLDMDGNWQTPQVIMPPAWAPPFTCGATTTWDAEIDAFAEVPGNGDYLTESGFVWLAPNNPREVVRMNDDYEALIVRFESPSRTFFETDVTTSYCPDPTEPTVINNSSSSTIAPARSSTFRSVTNVASDIEDNLNDDFYAGCGWSRYFQDFSLPGTVQTGQSLGGANMGVGALNHLGDQYARAANFHGSPHWLYALWFPYDILPDPNRWAVNGTPADLADYWYPVRQQWMNSPFLPGGVGSNRRVDVLAEGLDQSAITNVAGIVVSAASFWGIPEFVADSTAWQTAVQLNDLSNSRWTFDGTGTRQVTASRIEFSADSVEAEFDMSSYTVFPYMVPTLARNVALSGANWSNIASVKIEIEDATGKVTELVAAATLAGNWDIPAELSTKWHTSLWQNLGDSGFLADTYDDVAATSADYSPNIAASEELAPTQHGSKARSYGILRVTITKTNPANAATLGLITLNLAPRNEWHVRYESGHGATVISENGPLFRTQTLGFRDGLFDTLLSTPIVKPELIDAPTMGDWLSFRRAFLEGRDAQDAILAEGLTYFVNNEEMTIAKHLWRDPSQVVNNHSFIVQGDGGPVPCLVNGYRQVPPCSITPRLKRSKADDWEETGALGQYTYSLIANRRNIITTEVADIRLDFPGDVLTPEVSPPLGWEIEYHTSAVTNSEGYDAHLILDTTEFLKMRPWRGALIFPNITETVGDALAYDVSRSWRHAQSYLKDGTLWVRVSSTNAPYTWKDEDTGVAITFARIAYSRGLEQDALFLLTCESGSLILRKTSDEGASTTTMATIGTGDYGALIWTPNNLLWIFRLESGTIYARALDAALNTVYAEAATDITGVDNVAFDAQWSVDSTNKVRLGILYTVGGVLTFKTSFDGFTYT